MLRIGIIGTGRIAGRFAKEAEKVADVSIEVVYNPHKESALRFARQFQIGSFTQSLEELSRLVNAVYIASPHETHFDYTRQMLALGCHVLCEKPLALCRQEAEELFKLADEKRCVLMEAVKTAYCPGYQELIRTAKSGIIGKIRDVEACFTRLTPTNTRELMDLSYGGSFTEFGSYTMFPVFQLLGTEWDSVCFRSLPSTNGLDAYTKAEFDYKDAFGLAKTGLLTKSEGQLVVAGTKGYILAKSPWWLTREFEVRFEDPDRIERHTSEFEGTGLRYEVEAFVKAVRQETDKKSVIYGNDNPIRIKPEESIMMADTIGRFLKQRIEKADSVMTAFGPPLKIWAHRGMSFTYPENTLKAFEEAAKIPGITGVEFDVQLTKDGEVVVIHDEKVDRTMDGMGEVQDFTLKQIKALKIKTGNVGGVDGGNGSMDKDMAANMGEGTIPTLKETLELLKPYCLDRGLLINIELKNSVVRYPGMEEKVLNMVEELGLEQFVWYSSFLPESINMIKHLRPEAKTGILAVTLEDCIAYASQVKADALHPCTSGLNIALPESTRGMPVRLWNTDELFWGQNRTEKKIDLRKYAGFGVTDVFCNWPERYV